MASWVSGRVGVAVAVLGAAVTLSARAAGVPVAGLLGALLLVAWGSEAALAGLKGFMTRYRVSSHVAGVVSSAFANVPEALIVLMVGYRGIQAGAPEMVEVAVLTTMVAAGLNLLLLTLLVLMAPGRGLGVEEEAFRLEAPLLRVTVAATGMVAFYGLLEAALGTERVTAPPLISLALLGFYIYYSYGLFRTGGGGEEGHGAAGGRWWLLLSAGLGATVLASETFASTVEHLAEGASIPLLALALGAAGSIPEHGLALLTVRRGMGGVGLGNLLGGATQSILIVFPLASLLLPFTLDRYVTYQFAALSAAFWIILRCLSDDGFLDKSEAVLVALLQVAVYATLLQV